MLHSYSPQSKFDIVYLSSSRREFADYLDYNAIYFCPESLLHLDDYAKLVPVKLEKEIVFENCLAYRLNDDNPLLPSYAEFLRSLLKQKFF